MKAYFYSAAIVSVLLLLGAIGAFARYVRLGNIRRSGRNQFGLSTEEFVGVMALSSDVVRITRAECKLLDSGKVERIVDIRLSNGCKLSNAELVLGKNILETREDFKVRIKPYFLLPDGGVAFKILSNNRLTVVTVVYDARNMRFVACYRKPKGMMREPLEKFRGDGFRANTLTLLSGSRVKEFFLGTSPPEASSVA